MIQILIPMPDLGLRIEHRKLAKPAVREGGRASTSQEWTIVVEEDEMDDVVEKLLVLAKRLQGYNQVFLTSSGEPR